MAQATGIWSESLGSTPLPFLHSPLSASLTVELGKLEIQDGARRSGVLSQLHHHLDVGLASTPFEALVSSSDSPRLEPVVCKALQYPPFLLASRIH